MKRWGPGAGAAALLAALACWLLLGSGPRGRPRTWVDVYAAPRMTCYSGPPFREVAGFELWPNGPGFHVFREVPLSIPLTSFQEAEPSTPAAREKADPEPGGPE